MNKYKNNMIQIVTMNTTAQVFKGFINPPWLISHNALKFDLLHFAHKGTTMLLFVLDSGSAASDILAMTPVGKEV